eukprot:IDg7431t1
MQLQACAQLGVERPARAVEIKVRTKQNKDTQKALIPHDKCWKIPTVLTRDSSGGEEDTLLVLGVLYSSPATNDNLSSYWQEDKNILKLFS